ncbi:fungal-specific transcription factor domain-containing protein [Xylariales sp. AK1849]|nr:fungal-specific transcription factor domain-containing protein [Xylariales sp. AK1849]
MTRPKVDPDKRQRTACACDSCKRRKQKCNGINPCNTCIKRHLPCVYTPVPANSEPSQSPIERQTKRRHVDTSPGSLKSELEETRTHLHQAQMHVPTLGPWDVDEASAIHLPRSDLTPPATLKTHTGSVRNSLNVDVDSVSRSRMSIASGPADEAEVYLQRMLQDSTGRLLYVGDSATLSYLQLIRMIVDGIAGPSKFTMDPKRHMIMEAVIEPPPNNMPSGVLPDRRTADVLTIGFIEVFDRQTFLDQLTQCYSDPLTVDPSVLCQLYLVFAVGLVLSRPMPGSEEERIIGKLRANKQVNRADIFFRNAKRLADPVSGFEDADFWSVQALLLMALYMLSVSKRNAAYAYYGMAVRSAFALGLHREESMVIFSELERKVRRNLWRTLFVFDRFLAASLGRPTAISEEDCSEQALDAPEELLGPSGLPGEDERTNSAALDAAVKTCHVVGITLKKIYSKRKISTAVAQDIANQLEGWNEQLHPALHWRRATNEPVGPSHGIAILHINLLHCHSIILLTRPFFLYILNKAREHRAGAIYKPTRLSQKMDSFAQTCVEASQHTLTIAQAALDAKYLPQCNPFVIYFVFAAGLVVLSNEFALLYHNPDAEKAIRSCISILKYCAENDAQAERVTYIVETFNEANLEQPQSARKLSLPGRNMPVIHPCSRDPRYDPMAHFFDHGNRSPQQQLPAPTPMMGQARSLVSAGHPVSMSPVMPSVLQQPSPDATGYSPDTAAAAVPAPPGVHSMDALHAQEAEFDFDSLWPTWQAPPGGIPVPHHVGPSQAYGGYGLSQPQVALGHVLSANVDIPLYPAPGFR